MHAVIRPFFRPCVRLNWLCALVALCGASAQAQQDGRFEPGDASTPPLQLELAAMPVPSVVDGAGSRISLTGWSGAAAQAGVGLGLAVSDRRLLGLNRPASTQLDLGVNWRSAKLGQSRFQVGVWQRLSPAPDAMALIQQAATPANYDTRLEMQFSAASARGIQFELGGALGMQLNSNERLVLRVSRGKPMLYYRARF